MTGPRTKKAAAATPKPIASADAIVKYENDQRIECGDVAMSKKVLKTADEGVGGERQR